MFRLLLRLMFGGYPASVGLTMTCDTNIRATAVRTYQQRSVYCMFLLMSIYLIICHRVLFFWLNISVVLGNT